MIDALTDSRTVIRVIGVLIAYHTFLTSIEQVHARDRFEIGGIQSWVVSKEHLRSGLVSRYIGFAFRPPRFKYLLVVRLCVSVLFGTLIIYGNISPLLLFVLVLSNVAIVLRHHTGLSGDLDMSTIILVGLLLASVTSTGGVVERGAIIFIASQGILSYSLGGFTKLSAPQWRDGSALTGIFATETWGHEHAYRLLERVPGLSRVMAWGIIAFECLFPAVLLVEPNLAAVILATGVVFHLCTAVFMRLNGFLIAFPATYPAVYYANHLVDVNLL